MDFPEETVQKVWESATMVVGNDPEQWRKDPCGAWICRSQYKNRDSQYGWEIDYAQPDAGTPTHRNQRTAQFNLENDFYGVAINRAYYAFFYAATALLLTLDLTRSKHSG